ncbi:hypothetical protein EDC96DRAFT_497711 [Choanephora cucurbitarum]|nr:hypothetical protein EDC96DRAFT_497711 [Choanephora cucurbitarum]
MALKEKQPPYSPFIERVVLPTTRLSCLLLAVLAVGFGSWLETNQANQDCNFRNSLSVHQIQLYRNISSNVTTPDSVSFGLWKSCYFYALNCTCSSTNLHYQPDIQTLLEIAATTHLAKPAEATSHSFERVIPLVLATVLSSVACLLGFTWAKRRKQYRPRQLIVGLLFATLILIAYVFGSTYHQYDKQIKSTCSDPENSVLCAHHHVGIETILFSIALGLSFVGLLLWLLASGLIYRDPEIPDPALDMDEHIFRFWPLKRNKSSLTDSNKKLTEQSYRSQSPQDDMSAWHHASLLEENEFARGESTNRIKYDRLAYEYASQPSLSPQSSQKSRSFHPSLTPPPASASKARRSRVPPHKRVSKHRSTNQNRRQPTTRKESNDSAMTFGEKRRRRSSGRPLSGLQPVYQQPITPQSVPSPYYDTRKSSFCMTPMYYEETPSYSDPNLNYFEHQPVNPGQRSSSNQFPQRRISSAGIEHPLNKKMIRDKRIQKYFESSNKI